MKLLFAAFAACSFTGLIWCAPTGTSIPSPPSAEPIKVSELTLPPVTTGKCTKEVNPNGTGCIAQAFGEFQAGDFTPDGKHVVVNVQFVGAPPSPDPTSIYDGEQVILIKTDGTTFSNGDAWKCLSCGVAAGNKQSLDPQRDYPHVFRSGDKVLWGHNILDCSGNEVQSDACTPEDTHIYPIHWSGGAPRELRLHPDDIHMGFSSFTNVGGQFCYFGRLEFNDAPDNEPKAPRYDIVDVNLLYDPESKGRLAVSGSQITIDPTAITVGELRGFSGSGDEVIYLGATIEANNFDVFATHLITGATRRLTSHPEYLDPISFSADNQWMVIMDTRGSDRLMWAAGMRGVPPMIDLVVGSSIASVRNNGERRFFQPYLLDRHGDRYPYYGQRVNSEGDESDGSVNDPNWNGRADPAFSLDSTKIVYYQALVVSPACGGSNPLVCPKSTAQGGREYRVMLADLTSRKPTSPAPVFKVPDFIPWAVPYEPGDKLPNQEGINPGNYTLKGKASGKASVSVVADEATNRINGVSVAYNDYSDDGKTTLNGVESVINSLNASNPWYNSMKWHSNLTQTGAVEATKKSSPDGYHLEVDVMKAGLTSTGTLITTINGVVYEPPASGT